MKPITGSILAINCGSSSIKFALYDGHESLAKLASGEIENIGSKSAKFSFENFITHQKDKINIDAVSHNSAGTFLIDWLNKQEVFISVKAMGHRVVHGMNHSAPELVTPALIKELNEICAFDPEHLPDEISLIQLFTNKYPSLSNIYIFPFLKRVFY